MRAPIHTTLMLVALCGIGSALANQAPTVSISSPANEYEDQSAPATITINANAADSDGTITKVEFYQGTTLLGTATSSPYSYSWSNVAFGRYALTAKATDNAGVVTKSATVYVTVNGDPLSGFLERRLYSPANSTSAMPYRLWVPPNYSPSVKYPVVLFLHGVGEGGTDNAKQLNNNANGSMVFVNSTNQAAYPCIMIAPQSSSGWWSGNGTQIAIVQRILAKYSTDADRVYITGLSAGGMGTWATLITNPTMFAAAVPICGNGDTSKANLIAQIPIWDFHAADDPTVGVSGSDTMIAAIRAVGGNPIYTRYATGGHASWTPAYANPKTVPWVMAQKRGVLPTNSPLLTITSPTNQTAYSTSATTLNLSGTTGDSSTAVTGIAWTNSLGGSGSASGTSNWTITGLPLTTGDNLIQVIATGTSYSSGNGGVTTFNDTIKVTVSGGPPPDPNLIAAINCGATADYTAVDGTLYKADVYYDSGSTNNFANPIANTQDDTLYQSYRWNSPSFTYSIPVTNGQYAVTLKFADVYSTAVGQKSFSVTVEGVTVASALDTFALVGGNTAYDITCTANVTDGKLDIQCIAGAAGNPSINAILVKKPSGNTAPTISNIADKTINEDSNSGAVAFTIGDAETAAGSLTLAGTSSNTTLAPNANIVFGGSGANRTVTVTPAANQSGTATITVTVSDGALTASDTFVLTVTAVNDSPVIASVWADATTVTLPAGTTVHVTASDVDNATLTYAWSKVSGTGTATFATGTAAASGVTFSAAGSYVLRATVSDGTASVTGDVTVTVNPGVPDGTGIGLKGQYFDNADFTAAKLTRLDATVDFDWGNGAPDASIGVDTFSARWTGFVQPKYSETYTFYTVSDDGVRLWVNNTLLVDKWVDQGSTEWSGTIALTAGQKYSIKMEYYENGGGAVAKLLWSSASQAKGAVSKTQLYPATNALPVATAQTVATNEDTALAITLAATDADSDPFTLAVVAQPAHGTLSGTAPNLTYAPAANYNGSDSFTFKATDWAGDGAAATVSITVRPVNDPPVIGSVWADATTITLPSGTTVHVTATDIDNATLTYAWSKVSGPGTATFAAGTAAASGVTFSAAGSYVLRATVSDGTASVTGDVTITVNAAVPDGTGVGLKGQYFDNPDFSAPKLTRVDPQVDFVWAAGSPAAVIGAETFSVRWTGFVQPKYSETYTFYTVSDDGVRLWVNGTLLIDKWVNQGSTEWNGTLALTAGQKYSIKMEYYENGGDATARLLWSSATQAKGVIAKTQLYPAANALPVGVAQNLSANANTALAIVLSAADADGDALSFAVVSQPARGTLSGTAPNLTYTPAPNYSGSDSFTFKATDWVGDSAPASVAITVAPPISGSGTGLQGEYFDNSDFTALKLTRLDPQVDFSWGTGAPDATVGADTFSVRWTGYVQPIYGETYTFYTVSDDGVRLWVNGTKVVDNWTDHANTENSGTIALQAGRTYDIKIEFYENGGYATARLLWSSASQAKGVVPTGQLYPPVNTLAAQVAATAFAPAQSSMLGFDSAPSAGTTTGVAGQPATFSAAASAASGNTPACTWDFGDGTSGSGSSVTHTYATAGVYTVTVTITDGDASASSSLDFTVNAADEQGTPGNDPATDPAADPQVPPTPFSLLKGSMKFGFVAGETDMLKFAGTIPLPRLFKPAGKTVTVFVGDMATQFTLNTKGQGVSASGKLQLRAKSKAGAFVASPAKFTLTIKGERLAALIDVPGLDDSATGKSGRAISVPVAFVTDNVTYAQSAAMLYKTSAGKTGQAKTAAVKK